MRYVTFRGRAGSTAVGLVRDSAVHTLDVADMVTLLGLPSQEQKQLSEKAEAGEGEPLDAVDILMPVTDPGKIICLGLNYVDHAKEGGFQVPDYPAIFMRGRTSLIAAGAPLVRPLCSITFDYEAELAVIIGTSGRHIAEDRALDHVGGYSLFNDGSVREYQRRTHQWTAGKNFDGTGPFGPWIVTPDELPPGAAGLRIQSRLNGRILQDGNTNDMVFKVAQTISILSEVMTLETGDVIAMGTPPGVGHARKPPVWMKNGDVCEIEIEGIGILSNPVEDEVRSLASSAA